MVALKYTRRMTNLQIKPNPTIEVTWTTSVYDYSKSKELDVIEKISKKFGVDKKHINVVTNLVSGTGSEEIVSLRDDVIGDIQDPLFQQSLFEPYLKMNGTTEYDLDALLDIDRQVNAHIDYDSFVKAKNYFIKWVKWDNFLSYGENNRFDFTKYKGLVLLNGEPANQSGKTTFAMELIRFIFFGDTTKYKVQSDIFNKHLPEATTVNAEMCLTIDNQDYIIKRVLTRPALSKRTDKSAVKSSVTYYKVIGDTSVELTEFNKDETYNGDTVGQTNKAIKEAIGNADDFDLSLCATSKSLDSLIDKKSTERGRIFARWIGLLPLEKKDEVARDIFNKSIRDSLLVGKYNIETLLANNEKSITDISQLKAKQAEAEGNKQVAQAKCDAEQEKVKMLAGQKAQIDTDLIRMDITTVRHRIDSVTSEGINKKAELDATQKDIEAIGDVEYSIEHNDNLYKELNAATTRMSELRTKIAHNNSTINALKNSEYCPTCGRKYDNVDNSGKIQEIEDDTAAKQVELQQVESTIENKKKEIADYAEKGRLYNKYNSLVSKASSIQVTLSNLRAELLELRAKSNAYEQNKEAIDKNSEIDNQIAMCEANVRAFKQQVNHYTEEATMYTSQIASINSNIETNNELIERVKKDEVTQRNWKMYLDIVGKNGISKMVMRRALPIINANLSKLLNGVCDFDVEVVINDKNEVDFELIRDGVRANLSGGSGFEMTASALALRTVLANMSTMGRPQFIVFDEILGRVAKANYDAMHNLYNRILESYNLIMQVTFITEVADWHNAIITVNKVNNISKLQEEI